jgi:hypothetical protein
MHNAVQTDLNLMPKSPARAGARTRGLLLFIFWVVCPLDCRG